MLIKLAQALADFLYPPACVNCAAKVAESNILCDECRGRMAFVRSYEAGLAGWDHLDAVLVLAHYKGGFQELLHKAKFAGQKQLLKVLQAEFSLLWSAYGKREVEQLLANKLLSCSDFCFVPVPTDKERLLQRGYDLPVSIFADWCRHEGYTFSECLQRIRLTRPQYELDGQERRNNMIGAVQAKELPSEQVIIIADDILTTGATLSECARALRAAGGMKKFIIGMALCSDMKKH